MSTWMSELETGLNQIQSEGYAESILVFVKKGQAYLYQPKMDGIECHDLLFDVHHSLACGEVEDLLKASGKKNPMLVGIMESFSAPKDSQELLMALQRLAEKYQYPVVASFGKYHAGNYFYLGHDHDELPSSGSEWLAEKYFLHLKRSIQAYFGPFHETLNPRREKALKEVRLYGDLSLALAINYHEESNEWLSANINAEADFYDPDDEEEESSSWRKSFYLVVYRALCKLQQDPELLKLSAGQGFEVLIASMYGSGTKNIPQLAKEYLSASVADYLKAALSE